jgi:hypothetical protein
LRYLPSTLIDQAKIEHKSPEDRIPGEKKEVLREVGHANKTDAASVFIGIVEGDWMIVGIPYENIVPQQA